MKLSFAFWLRAMRPCVFRAATWEYRDVCRPEADAVCVVDLIEAALPLALDVPAREAPLEWEALRPPDAWVPECEAE